MKKNLSIILLIKWPLLEPKLPNNVHSAVSINYTFFRFWPTMAYLLKLVFSEALAKLRAPTPWPQAIGVGSTKLTSEYESDTITEPYDKSSKGNPPGSPLLLIRSANLYFFKKGCWPTTVNFTQIFLRKCRREYKEHFRPVS